MNYIRARLIVLANWRVFLISLRGFRPWQRHSLVLMVAGMVYVMIGISYIIAKPIDSRLVALEYALKWFSLDIWGIWFIITGLMSMLSSRWPPISKTWGYTMLTGLSSAWSGFYLAGILFGHSPIQNVSGVLSWGLIAFLWWAISGLINPDEGVHEWTPEASSQ